MSFAATAERAIAYMAYGLLCRDDESVKDDNGRKYFNSRYFRKGAEMILGLLVEYGVSIPEIFKYSDERSFIERFCMRPVSEWFEDFSEQITAEFRKSRYSEFGELVEATEGGTRFEPSDECRALAKDIYKNSRYGKFGELYEELGVFRELDGLKEYGFYQKGRQLLIERPVLWNQDEEDAVLYDIVGRGEVKEIFEKLFRTKAYNRIANYHGHDEAYKCPHCGGVVLKRDNGYRCTLMKCENVIVDKKKRITVNSEFPRQINPGVINFIYKPGRLEMEILKILQGAKSIEFEIWPCNDVYDFEIRFPGGERWVIDAKAYSNLKNLERLIRREHGLPKQIDFARGFYVLPNTFAQSDINWNVNIKNIDGCRNTQCVNVSTFQDELNEKIGKL